MNHIGIKHPQAHNQTFSREGFDCHYSGEVVESGRGHPQAHNQTFSREGFDCHYSGEGVESGRGHPCPQAHNQTFSREGVQLPLQWGRVGVVGKIEIFALKWCILVHKTCTINFWTWWSHGIHMNHLHLLLQCTVVAVLGTLLTVMNGVVLIKHRTNYTHHTHTH